MDQRELEDWVNLRRKSAARYPLAHVDPDKLFIRDGKLFTSAGVSEAIDLALALIEEDHGHKLAVAIARDMVMYLKRPGGQSQYSVPLAAQARAQLPIAKAQAVIFGLKFRILGRASAPFIRLMMRARRTCRVICRRS